jgi:hypothetical protein
MACFTSAGSVWNLGVDMAISDDIDFGIICAVRLLECWKRLPDEAG